MLLPITSAVYVSGNLLSNDKILLDIGTGYFAEVCNTENALQVLYKNRFVPAKTEIWQLCRGRQQMA